MPQLDQNTLALYRTYTDDQLYALENQLLRFITHVETIDHDYDKFVDITNPYNPYIRAMHHLSAVMVERDIHHFE